MEKGTCEFCKYWNAEHGTCHRRAPAPNPNTGRGWFPRMSPDEWCAEGEAKGEGNADQ